MAKKKSKKKATRKKTTTKKAFGTNTSKKKSSKKNEKCICKACKKIIEVNWRRRYYIIYRYQLSKKVLENKILAEKLVENNPGADLENSSIYYVGQTHRDIEIRIAQHLSRKCKNKKDWCKLKSDWGEFMLDGSHYVVENIGQLSDNFRPEELKKRPSEKMLDLVLQKEKECAEKLRQEGHASYFN
jgi:hypothetical protein